MRARTAVVWLVAVVTLAASGVYLFVYLYRWEWNRALISGVIFLAVEVAIVGWVLNNKLSGIKAEVDAQSVRRIEQHIDAGRDRRSHVFDWLRPDSSVGVFVPILMGAGLVLSGVAWLVERLGRTVGRPAERRLAGSLARLTPPPGGFLDDGCDRLRDLRGPAGGRW